MPDKTPLTLYQGNTEQVDITVTLDGAVYDLTGATLNAYFKATPGTADDDPGVTLLTTGDGIEVTEAAAGQATITVPAAALATAGHRWYRVDVVAAGATRTCVYGPCYVVDL